MSKLQIIGLEKQKEQILDQIFLCHNAHIVKAEKVKGVVEDENAMQDAELEQNLKNTQKAILALEKIEPKNHEKIECLFSDFLQQESNAKNVLQDVLNVCEILDNISENFNLILKHKASMYDLLPQELKQILKLNKQKSQTLSKIDEKTKGVLNKIYKSLNLNEQEDFEEIDFQSDGKNLFLKLSVQNIDYENLLQTMQNLDDFFEVKRDATRTELVFSFKKCQPDYYKDYEQKVETLKQKIEECENLNVDLYNKLVGYTQKQKDFKILCDFLTYKYEKLLVNGFLTKTQKTFALLCYVPKAEKKSFCEALENKFDALVVEEQKILPTDEPPTQIKTSKIAKQADFVINQYSVPRYTDVDPTWSVFLFFMIFFGFIIADVGYGIVLCALGFLLASRKKTSSGAKRLLKLIGTAGIFAIVWGMLFGSVFGFSHQEFAFIPNGVMPNPQTDPIRLLLICLLMGALQIAYGYLLRGIKLFKNHQICAGIVNGVAWVMFMLGGILASAKFLLDFFKLGTSKTFYEILTAVQLPGLIVMLVGLVVGVIFAGVGTRGFKKVTKSFSALYGIINLFSDILSYARLFGLMLSGAIIAQQFNAIALSVMNGFAGYIFGFLIMLVGHSFNIAMSSLSAYIHDVRLQYVEFFGKFYDGDGKMFKPFGANLNYVTIKN